MSLKYIIGIEKKLNCEIRWRIFSSPHPMTSFMLCANLLFGERIESTQNGNGTFSIVEMNYNHHANHLNSSV